MNQKDNMVARITIEVRSDEKEGLYSDIDMGGDNFTLIAATLEVLSYIMKSSSNDGATADELADFVRDILRDLLEEEEENA